MNMKAKRHSMLNEVTAAISGRLPEVIEEVLGVRYRMRLVKPEAEDWIASNTGGTTVTAALLNSRKPTLACALVSIARPSVDGEEWEEIPVEKLFEFSPDMDTKVKEALMQDSKFLRDWRREQILEWMREEMDVFILDKLYDAYAKLVPKHKEAMKEISGFLKGTPSAD